MQSVLKCDTTSIPPKDSDDEKLRKLLQRMIQCIVMQLKVGVLTHTFNK